LPALAITPLRHVGQPLMLGFHAIFSPILLIAFSCRHCRIDFIDSRYRQMPPLFTPFAAIIGHG
jgi:hypothetical protein